MIVLQYVLNDPLARQRVWLAGPITLIFIAEVRDGPASEHVSQQPHRVLNALDDRCGVARWLTGMIPGEIWRPRRIGRAEQLEPARARADEMRDDLARGSLAWRDTQVQFRVCKRRES